MDLGQITNPSKLTLVNGEPISVMVTDLAPEDFRQGKTEQSLERVTLDVATVANILHVLEGIAANERPGSRNGGQGTAGNAGWRHRARRGRDPHGGRVTLKWIRGTAKRWSRLRSGPGRGRTG